MREVKKVENINITPDKSIYHKIGEANYSIPDAIAELVDNSIDAADEDGVEISIILDKENNEIIVEDTGIGMNKEVASKCLVLAHSKKESNLGEFGLGLKSACASLGNVFEVITTQADNTEQYLLKYDKEKFLESGDWNNYPLSILDASVKSHGTTIRISSLRVKLYDALVTRLKKDLSLRYTPYIEHNNVIIRVGLKKGTAKACSPESSRLVSDQKEYFEFKLSNGGVIKGWYGLLEVGSQKNSGFNMFRRGRLIRASEKLGYNYHPTKMNIAGEINMDCVPVTHNKREFILESGEFKEFIEKFWGDQTERLYEVRIKGLIDSIVKRAVDRSSKEKADKSLPIEKKETLKSRVLEGLNRADDFKELAFLGLDQAKRSDDGKTDDMEKREKGLKVAHEETVQENEQPQDKRTPHKTQQKKAKFIMVAGKKFKFDFFLQNLSNDTVEKEYIINENKFIEIYINTGFRGYTLTKDTDYYVTFYVSEAIAEIYVKEAKQGPERIFELRNSLILGIASVVLDEERLVVIEKEKRELEKKIAEHDNLLRKKEMAGL